MWRVNNVLVESVAIVQRAFSVLWRFCSLSGIIELITLTIVIKYRRCSQLWYFEAVWLAQGHYVSTPIIPMNNKLFLKN